jgi:hypothetical protein
MTEQLVGTCKIVGPMWQAECTICQEMLDAWDSRQEAEEDAREHNCGWSLTAFIGMAMRAGWRVEGNQWRGWTLLPPEGEGT